MPSAVPEFLQQLLKKPVAVFGAGVSGAATCELVAALGTTAVLFDEKAPASKSDFTRVDATACRLVIYSPGFRGDHTWLIRARESGCTCISELDFGSLFWRGRTVAITGTNGKTTLTEFLTHSLRQLGQDAVAVGNIGLPISRAALSLRTTESVTAICEVSSFQAESLQYFRPDHTIWTNFAEDHLERHVDLKEYFEAKWKLVERTQATVLAAESVRSFAEQFNCNSSKVTFISTQGLPDDPRLKGTAFENYPQRENYALAEAWWQSSGYGVESLVEAVKTFQVGGNRLAKVAERRGVTFWNDSKATNFHAVEGALQNFPRPVIWIGGGKAKGGDIRGFMHRISTKIKHAFLIGETAACLGEVCALINLPCTLCKTLTEAVEKAFSCALAADVILFSPGFASFDMFKNYQDRGAQFESAVNNL